MSAPPRNAVAFLTLFTVLNDMRLRAREGDFAACGRRPKVSALWKLATFEKVDETFPCGFAARGFLDSALNKIYLNTISAFVLTCLLKNP